MTTNRPWESNSLTYDEAADIARRYGYDEAAGEMDRAGELWFDEDQPENDREDEAERIFLAALQSIP